MNELLTVCIPMYNASSKIKRCLNSIKKSTIKVKIIVIDDNSTDDSYNIVADLGLDNLLLVKNTFAKGPGPARNLGINLCSTEYITFCDADDFIPDFAYEKLLDTAIANASDMVIGQYLRKIDNSKWYTNTLLKDKYRSKDYNHAKDESIIHISPAVWNKIFKVSILKNNNIYFRQAFLAEDLEFSSHYFSYSKTVNMIDDVVYFYHTETSSDNIISTISIEKFIQGISCFEKTLAYSEDRNKSLSLILNNSFKFLYNKLFLSSPADIALMLGEIKSFLKKYQDICDPFLVFSILGESIDKFVSSDPVDFCIRKKNTPPITLDSIKNDIESKFGSELSSIPIEYLNLYLSILVKKKSWTAAFKLFDSLENNDIYKITILKYKYEIFKTVKLWNKALDVCKELVMFNQDDYRLDLAVSLKMCAEYKESYQLLQTHVDENNMTYWRLRAELAEYMGCYSDAISAWKQVALCDSSQLMASINNIRSLHQCCPDSIKS